MDDINRKDLSGYRLSQAEQCLKSAKILYEAEDYKGAANRAYYCIFHSIRSVIALDGVEFKRHSGNTTYFRKEYIKTGKFDESMSDIITKAFNIRSDSDYDDFYFVSKNETMEQINNAELFLERVKEFFGDNLKE